MFTASRGVASRGIFFGILLLLPLALQHFVGFGFLRQVTLVRFQVLTAASMKFRVFWDILPCSQIHVGRRFVGACCLRNVGRHRFDYIAIYPRRLKIILAWDFVKVASLNAQPPTWRASSQNLYPPWVGYPSYTPRHWVAQVPRERHFPYPPLRGPLELDREFLFRSFRGSNAFSVILDDV
jgi:hypothetical protein